MGRYRRVIAYKKYFEDFLDGQSPRIQAKILQVLRIIEEVEIVPANYLKHIEGTDGLYEIRTGFSNLIFRIFCIFDSGNIIVLLSGFQKKTRKTPKKEIDKALSIMQEYYKDKLKEQGE